jgi:hypothetical protein
MAKDDALKRLGGGRWETRDGRFQIEPQSGTWVIVDTTQTDDFGLPLVRGPFPSLTAAKEAIETTRTEGPVESPLAGRVATPKTSSSAKSANSKTPAKASATVESEPEPEPAGEPEPEPPPPPDPKWIRDLRPIDRRKAKDLIARLEGLGVTEAESVARGEVAQGLPAVARLAIERHIRTAVGNAPDVDAAVAAVVEAMTAGADADLGVAWRLVDDRGRPIDKIDPGD